MTQPLDPAIMPLIRSPGPPPVEVQAAPLPPGVELPVVLEAPAVPTRRVVARVRRVGPARQDLAVTDEDLLSLGESTDGD